MNEPLVSVIIPNYNYENFIVRTVESVFSQTYKNFEIVVVDDGSNDNSIKVLNTFGNKIKIIEQENAGVSAARNNGVKNSTGDYIAFLDADDVWLPEKLEKQMKKFETDSETGFVHSSMKLINSEDKQIGEICNGMEGQVSEEFLRFKKGVVVGAGSTGVVKREIFNEIGGFDSRLSTAADWDFCYRIAKKYKIGFVEEPLVLYLIHDSNMHSNISVMESDMMLGFEKAFSASPSQDKNDCYSNLHLTLAGSYFQSKKYADFLRHSFKSIWLKPANIVYFAKFPFRKLNRI